MKLAVLSVEMLRCILDRTSSAAGHQSLNLEDGEHLNLDMINTREDSRLQVSSREAGLHSTLLHLLHAPCRHSDETCAIVMTFYGEIAHSQSRTSIIFFRNHLFSRTKFGKGIARTPHMLIIASERYFCTKNKTNRKIYTHLTISY